MGTAHPEFHIETKLHSLITLLLAVFIFSNSHLNRLNELGFTFTKFYGIINFIRSDFLTKY